MTDRPPQAKGRENSKLIPGIALGTDRMSLQPQKGTADGQTETQVLKNHIWALHLLFVSIFINTNEKSSNPPDS